MYINSLKLTVVLHVKFNYTMRAIILLAFLGSALAGSRMPQRIVGGEATVVEQYPFMANMQYRLWGIWWLQFCGGSLVTANTVISASHCYEGDVASQWNVRLGTSLSSSGGSLFTVNQLILHPGYSGETLDNDIAIIRLATSAVYSTSVQPVRIAGANYILPDGTDVTTIGWGALYTSGPSPEQLQHVDIQTVNQDLCAARYAYLKTLPGYENWPDITDNMLCAGILNVGGKDACQGDSGGPLVHDRDVLIGVVSWGFQCADSFYPGVNARVSQYTDWIVANA